MIQLSSPCALILVRLEVEYVSLTAGYITVCYKKWSNKYSNCIQNLLFFRLAFHNGLICAVMKHSSI